MWEEFDVNEKIFLIFKLESTPCGGNFTIEKVSSKNFYFHFKNFGGRRGL